MHPAAQDRLDQLAARVNDGDLTFEEADEGYRLHVDAINLIGFLQAKARAMIGKLHSAM